jgi:GNAT superfamily N-acetyltransferase
MIDEQYDLTERPPTVEEYRALRRAVGWAEVDAGAVAKGLANSLFSVCVLHEGNFVGCGRVVGDGGVYFYIQDVMVLPAYQRRGLGRRIMNAIMTFIAAHARSNTFIGLMAADGVAPFYHDFGFAERPPNRPGMFQLWHP